jgi:hypothetical protein
MNAQLTFALLAVALVIIISALGISGIVHPFTARAFAAFVVVVWAFLALLPLCKEGSK